MIWLLIGFSLTGLVALIALFAVIVYFDPDINPDNYARLKARVARNRHGKGVAK